ncbi:MAG: hypothetical protein AB7D57_06470 [Desulfovibrionaceae bacterium]
MAKIGDIGGVWPRGISRTQARDTGLALVLLCLLVGLWSAANGGGLGWFRLAAALVVLVMVWPRAFTPLGYLWFGLANLLGAVVPKVLIAVVFFLVVTPVGLARRVLGKDSLRLRAFGRSRGSVFVERDTTYAAADLEQPF